MLLMSEILYTVLHSLSSSGSISHQGREQLVCEIPDQRQKTLWDSKVQRHPTQANGSTELTWPWIWKYITLVHHVQQPHSKDSPVLNSLAQSE